MPQFAAAFVTAARVRKKTNWPTTSRQSRGYDAEWEKKRLRILERDRWLCQCPVCKAGDLVTYANQVHHIKSKASGGTDDDKNLASINDECHKRETILENGGTYRPRRYIGLDGFPISRPVAK